MHIFAVTPCQAFVDPAWHDQCQTPVEACTLLFSLSETVLEAIVAVWIWHTSDGTPSFGHALLAHAVCKCLAVGKMVGNPGEKREGIVYSPIIICLRNIKLLYPSGMSSLVEQGGA